MAERLHPDRVWDIIELVGVCMFTTRFAGGLRARPLESRPDRQAGLIWCMADLHSAKAVSYTHLDVYKRQPIRLYEQIENLQQFLNLADSFTAA